MNAISNPSAPPSKFLMWAEWRAITELGAFAAAIPFLRTLPKGDGHPVLILPGLSASDMSTIGLREYLSDRGYRVYGWDLGRNVGYRPGLQELKHKRLQEIFDRHDGQKVSLIGWSLGGIYARQLAKEAPDRVRQVITLGTPFKGEARATNAWRLYEFLAGHTVDEVRAIHEIASPPDVPFTSIYSRTDGIVSWQCSIEDEGEERENVEILGSHCGLGHNPLALYVIADRLAQPEGEWKPFDGRSCRTFFPDPARRARPH